MKYIKAKIIIKIKSIIIRFVPKPIPITYIGEDKISALPKLLQYSNHKNVLIITDNNLYKMGFFDTIVKSLEDLRINIVVFKDVNPNPTFSEVRSAIESCKNCDSVIAIGGGSVIDCAKVVCAAIPNNTDPVKLVGLFKVKKNPLPFICIPTTSGTGSEVSLGAVISDDVTHQKNVVIDYKLVPQVAILDPLLTVELPKSVTIHTAMDALTHGIESYTSKFATEKSIHYATVAIKMIFENLDKVYQHPNDIEARENLLVASFYAGLAFTRTYVGYVHAFSHSIGGMYNLSHGLVNAVLLPHIMRMNKEACKEQYAAICGIVGLCDKEDSLSVKTDKLIATITSMNKRYSVSDKLTEIRELDIDKIIKLAFKEAHGTYHLPKYFTYEEAREFMSNLIN